MEWPASTRTSSVRQPAMATRSAATTPLLLLLLQLLPSGPHSESTDPFGQCWKPAGDVPAGTPSPASAARQPRPPGPAGVWAPCDPGNDQCGPPSASLSFHIQDTSCPGGDTDFPFWDEVHGVYHLMYQDHVGNDPWTVIGHVVSRDMLHWAHMPVAIWPDRPWDRGAIFTGSATVVDGKPFLIYPGMTNGKWPHNSSAVYGGAPTLAQAVPADPSDPLLTNCERHDNLPPHDTTVFVLQLQQRVRMRRDVVV